MPREVPDPALVSVLVPAPAAVVVLAVVAVLRVLVVAPASVPVPIHVLSVLGVLCLDVPATREAHA